MKKVQIIIIAVLAIMLTSVAGQAQLRCPISDTVKINQCLIKLDSLLGLNNYEYNLENINSYFQTADMYLYPLEVSLLIKENRKYTSCILEKRSHYLFLMNRHLEQNIAWLEAVKKELKN